MGEGLPKGPGMKLNLRQIEMFRAIMITGSVSGAARMLSVSQPAISRLLAYTEDRLKMRLFERVKGRVQPTPEARRLFAEVEDVHRGVLRINDLAQELQRRGTGALHVVSSPSIAQSIVPAAIGRFRRLYPDVFVEMEILTLRELVDRVRAGRADVGLTGMPVDDPTVTGRPLSEGRMSVICRHDHSLAAMTGVPIARLCDYPVIGYHSQTPYGDIAMRAIEASGVEIAFDTVVRFSPAACALVQAGVGVAIADDFVVHGDAAFPDLVARPLLPEIPMIMSALHSSLEPPSRLAEQFIAAVAAVMAGGDSASVKNHNRKL